MANIDLLQHEIERFGVVTVMDVTLFDILTGRPVLFLDTLKISNISGEGQEKEITGGRYAERLLGYNYGRRVNLEFQDALLSPASMKHLWGAKQSANTVGHTYEVLSAVVSASDATVTLAGPNKATAVILGVTDLTDGIVYETADWSFVLGTGVLTIEGAAATAGNSIRVDYTYTAAAGAQVSEMVITASSFPTTVKLVGQSFVLNQATGQQVNIEIEVPKLKLASNFTMTLDAEGDASVFDFSGMALTSGAEKELVKIKLLGYAA